MSKKTAAVTFDAVTVIQIVAAVFLFTLGLIGIIDWNSNLAQFGRGVNKLFGKGNDPFNIIMSIVELVAGVIVLAALFVPVKSRALYALTLVIAIVWVVQIIIGFFTQGMFEPDFIIWLNRLAAEVIVLLALWMINRRYA